MLRHMYMAAQQHCDTVFYCYANSDILFDLSLINTLTDAILPYLHQFNGLMLIGVRTNVPVPVNQTISTFQEIQTLAKGGKLFGVNSQDYFVTTRDGFPWELVPDFVVGRAGYDNWLVAKALELQITTVDATSSILAFHQSDSEGNFAWKAHNSERHINFELAVEMDDYYKVGHTDCTPYVTKLCNSTSGQIIEQSPRDKVSRHRCENSVTLTSRLIDHCYKMRRKLDIPPHFHVDFHQTEQVNYTFTS